MGLIVKKQDMKNAENNVIFLRGVLEFDFGEVGVDESVI